MSFTQNLPLYRHFKIIANRKLRLVKEIKLKDLYVSVFPSFVFKLKQNDYIVKSE